MRPNQKEGRLKPKVAKSITNRSRADPRRIAERMPRAVPIVNEMRIAAPASKAVFLNRLVISPKTGPPQDDGVAEISPDYARGPDSVLENDRLIQTQLMAKRLDFLNPGIWAQHDLGRITWSDMNEAEHDDRDADDDHDHPEEPTDQIMCHDLLRSNPGDLTSRSSHVADCARYHDQ